MGVLGLAIVAVIGLVGAAFIGVVVALGVLLRAVFWLVLLPLKLLFVGLSAAVLLPLFFVAGVLLLAAVATAVVTPLLPVLLLVFVVWAIVKLAGHRSTPAAPKLQA